MARDLAPDVETLAPLADHYSAVALRYLVAARTSTGSMTTRALPVTSTTCRARRRIRPDLLTAPPHHRSPAPLRPRCRMALKPRRRPRRRRASAPPAYAAPRAREAFGCTRSTCTGMASAHLLALERRRRRCAVRGSLEHQPARQGTRRPRLSLTMSGRCRRRARVSLARGDRASYRLDNNVWSLATPADPRAIPQFRTPRSCSTPPTPRRENCRLPY